MVFEDSFEVRFFVRNSDFQASPFPSVIWRMRSPSEPSEIGAEKMHCKHFQEKEKRIGSNCDGYSCCVLSEALSFPIELLKPVRNPSIFRAGCIVQWDQQQTLHFLLQILNNIIT